MKFKTLSMVAFASFCIIGDSLASDTEVKVSGQVRVRSEADKRSFADSAIVQSWSIMRTRINLDATVAGNTRAFVQFQDSRTLGGINQFGTVQSAGLNDGKNVDIHQAFIQINNFFGEGWGVKAGRFEFNLGNERTFGAVGWDNVGRVMEGEALWYDNASVNILAWDAKAIERNDVNGNRDFDVVGLNVTLKDHSLEFYSVLEYDAQEVDASGDNLLNRASLSGYWKGKKKHVDVEINVVYQLGDMLVDTGTLTPSYRQLDIAAFMFAAEVGYTFQGAGNARIAGGIDYASGDDDPTDKDHNAFNNMYYTGHKFRGYMDYFLASEMPGLMDLMLRGKVDPTTGWTIMGDLHYFKTAQDYTDFLGALTTDVGVEFDFTVSTTRIAGAKLMGGVAFFFPTDSYAGFLGSEAGMWAYSQALVDF